jgi:AraC-like DNA-binding protein
MGFVAYSSPDFLTALQAIHTFLPTRASFIQLHLRQVNERLECILDYQESLDDDIQRCLSDAMVKALFEFGEFIIGRPLHEAEICFAHPEPPYQAMYADFLPGQIRFDCDQLKLTLPMSLCQEPNASANHENYRLALQQCESMLAQLQSDKPSYQTQLKMMMLSRPPGTLSEDEAAASLFMSKRTLARKLKQERSGFRKVRDEILSQQTATYLRDSQLSIEAIAALMNYHDSANFRRAFKRWFDQSPEQFRQNVRSQTVHPHD